MSFLSLNFITSSFIGISCSRYRNFRFDLVISYITFYNYMDYGSKPLGAIFLDLLKYIDSSQRPVENSLFYFTALLFS